MHRYVVLLLGVLTFFSCKKDNEGVEEIADDVNNTATILWQGFYHNWVYNHRVNRIGDWVYTKEVDDNVCIEHVHSAASGAGEDKLDYTSFLTKLTTTETKFSNHNVSFIIQGQEDNTTSESINVSIPLPSNMQNLEKYDVFLAGFDMYSRGKGAPGVIGGGDADKVYELELGIGDITYNSTDNTIGFALNVQLGGSCSSPECNNNSNKFDYQVNTFFTAVGGSEGVINITEQSIGHNYDWKAPLLLFEPWKDPNEIFREDFTLSKEISGAPNDYNIGIPLFKQFHYVLEKGCCTFYIPDVLEYQHMLGLNIALNAKNYDVASGKLSYSADLFFKSWAANRPTVLSYGTAGKATFSAKVALLQIKDSNASHESLELSGNIWWQTNFLNQLPANSEKALDRNELCL